MISALAAITTRVELGTLVTPAGMRNPAHLGKIIAISLSTGEGRVYASGLRNPQGLTVARDGRVWETEHGPRGGDEVNLIREGGNYGWRCREGASSACSSPAQIGCCCRCPTSSAMTP